MKRTVTIVAALVAGALAASGCANPDAPVAGRASQEKAANVGEPASPPPRPPSSEHVTATQSTAGAAVERFAAVYTNWDCRTLAADQRTLAAIAVGPARLQARQAAASARNQTLIADRVWNRGETLAVASDRARPGWWLIVTREQTGGEGEYAALPTTYHLTLARAVPVSGGWAVSEWQPQS